MTEHLFQLIVVWTLFASSITQAVFHFVTAWALGPQPKEDPIGSALRRREISLGVKGLARALFDTFLVALVMGYGLPFVTPIRNVVYSGATLTAIVALWFGWRFINALRQNNWGRPSAATLLKKGP